MPYHDGDAALKQVDGFKIGPLLHTGAMGNIYEVTRPDIGARIIMKVPRVGRHEPSEEILHFETEATILPSLSGPHVPRFIAVGDLARTPYIVSEWIDGISLEHVLKAGPLPPVEVARIGASIASAVYSLHQQQVIHHDLKPENVILKKDGRAALIDYGFAHHQRFPDLLAEETRFSAGSSAYVSPEQLLGTREDPRSDIFSLGVILYEMATGEFPFGEPDTDVRNRFWFDPLPPVVRAPDTPPWLQEIILRCLETRASARYQSASLVAFDLRNPEHVVLTARATKSRKAGFIQLVRRFFKARREFPHRLSPATRSPIIMVAVDTTHPDDERQPAIHQAAAQMLSLNKEFRLICVTVIPSEPFDSERQREHLVRLRHWVEPLRMPAQRLSLHAIESENPAKTLVEFANANHVDLIILGAPGPESGRAWWSSVASTVTADAHCSVHVVRV